MTRPRAGASVATAPSPWNLPNLLTVGRLLLVPLFGWLLMYDGGAAPAYRFGALGVFVLALATDRIDGDLARRRGQVTSFGQIADPIADKALLGMAFVGLSLLREVPWWITVVVLVREVGITLIRFVVIRHGVMPAGHGGKLKVALQALALSLYLLPLSALPGEALWRALAAAVLGAAVAVTVLTGVDYLRKARRLRTTSPRAAAKRARRQARGR